MTNPWLHWWTDSVPLSQQSTFPRLLLALLLGTLIGAERQWRQRAAGLRTKAVLESSTRDPLIMAQLADEIRALPCTDSVDWTETESEN